MAFSLPVVGCLVKKSLQRGGGGFTGYALGGNPPLSAYFGTRNSEISDLFT